MWGPIKELRKTGQPKEKSTDFIIEQLLQLNSIIFYSLLETRFIWLEVWIEFLWKDFICFGIFSPILVFLFFIRSSDQNFSNQFSPSILHWTFFFEIKMLHAIISFVVIALAYGFQCSNYNSNMGATFDLTDLVRWDFALKLNLSCNP